MKRLITIATIVFITTLFNVPLTSASPPTPDVKSEQQYDNPSPPVTLSAIAPFTPSADDEHFVEDSGGDLGQYLYRDDVPNGRLSFDIPIRRFHMTFE